jgi:hypothetical protein
MNGICGPRAVSSTFHLREKGLAEVAPGEVDETGLLDAFGLADAEAVDLVELLPFADVEDVTDPVATALLAFRGLSADFCLLVENCFRSFCAWMVPCDSLWSVAVQAGGAAAWQSLKNWADCMVPGMEVVMAAGMMAIAIAPGTQAKTMR